MRCIVALCALVLAGCESGTLDPLPLNVTLAASSTTPARGDTVTFTVNAQGGSLLGVEIDFGDGGQDAFGLGGARTARVSFRHAYGAAGSYTVVAALADATLGTRTASVVLTVP